MYAVAYHHVLHPVAVAVALVASGLSLVPALQVTASLQHLEVNRALAVDLRGAVSLDDVEPRHRVIAERDDLQFLLGQQSVVVGPWFDVLSRRDVRRPRNAGRPRQR